jgi:hypothetical protein
MQTLAITFIGEDFGANFAEVAHKTAYANVCTAR